MKNIYKHVISIAVFISLTVYLFNPVFFENKGIKQHDIEQWKYSANETIEFRKKNNEEAMIYFKHSPTPPSLLGLKD